MQARESYSQKRTGTPEGNNANSPAPSASPRATEGEDSNRSEKSDSEKMTGRKMGNATDRGNKDLSHGGDDERESASSFSGADNSGSGQWDDSRKSRSQQDGESARDSEEGHLNDGDKNLEQDADELASANDVKNKQDGQVSNTGQTDEERKFQADLLKQLMNRLVQLEAEARQMLLDSMDVGVARTLLLADRNGEFACSLL